jgi:hypothetical protein
VPFPWYKTKFLPIPAFDVEILINGKAIKVQLDVV